MQNYPTMNQARKIARKNIVGAVVSVNMTVLGADGQLKRVHFWMNEDGLQMARGWDLR